MLLAVRQPLYIVNGRQSSLAFGATFPQAGDVFWEAPRLGETWARERRTFLLSIVPPEQSVVRTLPAGSVTLIGQGGGRWLYANRGE